MSPTMKTLVLVLQALPRVSPRSVNVQPVPLAERRLRRPRSPGLSPSPRSHGVTQAVHHHRRLVQLPVRVPALAHPSAKDESKKYRVISAIFSFFFCDRFMRCVLPMLVCEPF